MREYREIATMADAIALLDEWARAYAELDSEWQRRYDALELANLRLVIEHHERVLADAVAVPEECPF